MAKLVKKILLVGLVGVFLGWVGCDKEVHEVRRGGAGRELVASAGR
jgi:hypothetical protein